MDIREIVVPDTVIRVSDIRDLKVMTMPGWMKEPPQALPIYPPVTEQIGTPIVNIPGCVEAHKDNRENLSLKDEDPKNVQVYCDAGTPSFNPVDYDPNRLNIERENKAPDPPPYKPPEPKVEAPPTKAPSLPPCPTEEQTLKEPVGTIVNNGTQKIIEYKRVGKECLPVKEKLSVPDQVIQALPSPAMVTATASIAVVATTSALLAKPLADLVLKAVKPTVKKVMKKIASLRGKTLPVLSRSEKIAEQRVRNHAIRKLKGKE
jgi:hypothetical protein